MREIKILFLWKHRKGTCNSGSEFEKTSRRGSHIGCIINNDKESANKIGLKYAYSLEEKLWST